MQKVILCLIVLSLGIYWAFAQEGVSLIGNESRPQLNAVFPEEIPPSDPVIAPTKETPDVSSSPEDNFAVMKSFMNQENAKEKEIRLLNLDLERINLQLKRQKLLTEIQGSSRGEETSLLTAVDIPNESVKDTHIVYLVYSSDFKEVILNMNGTVHRLRENDQASFGVTIKNILEDGVVVQAKDGMETKIPFLGISDL